VQLEQVEHTLPLARARADAAPRRVHQLPRLAFRAQHEHVVALGAGGRRLG
jgi:hypothetical protein